MRSSPGQRMLFKGSGFVTCRRCGRLLRSKTSIQRRYGWTCWLRTLKVKPKLPRGWRGKK